MRLRITYFCLLSISFLPISCSNKNDKLVYKDSTASIDDRVADLLGRMTQQEKFWQLFMIPGDLDKATPDPYKNGLFGFQVSAATSGEGGANQQILSYNNQKEDAYTLAKKVNSIQKYFIEKTRLGIPLLFFDEALHGLVRDGATAFPQSIALAASFDTSLMRSVSTAIAEETKVRGIRQILSPVVNLAADVRWGRTEETYGEDPFHTSEMGVVFVSSFERKNIVTTPKHFIANVGDGGRDSYPIHLSERALGETHFIPFKACFERGGSRSVMTAYNSLNGEASTANDWLLNKKLKGDWKFNGFVISDAAATGGTVVLHNTAVDYPQSAADAIGGGLDVIFQTEFKHHELFDPHFYDTTMDQKRIDDAVARVLRAKFQLGLFDQPYIDEEAAKRVPNHKLIARQAAVESIVLLKNRNNILPLKTGLKKIALIGSDARDARLGGYSGPGNGKISIEQGLKSKLGGIAEIIYAEGVNRNDKDYQSVTDSMLWHKEDGMLKPGLKTQVYENIDLSGTPIDTFTDATVQKSWTLSRPSSKLKKDFYSVRWNGVLKTKETGIVRLGLEGNDGYRLYLDDKLVIDSWTKQSFHARFTDVNIVAGREYAIRIEFFEPVANGHIRLVYAKNDDRASKINEAANAARSADLAIVVAGIDEGEFRDRASLRLPGKQEELIKAVAKTGKPTVVILVAGSAVVMNEWIDDVDGLLDIWYPGEEGGNAVAEILLGEKNPAGRLPITFPISEAQLPLVYNHQPTGRGDDYLNLSGRPLFPFGFGLSFTSFSYSDIKLVKDTIGSTESVRVNFKLQNTGAVAGEEVVQLYVRDLLSSMAQPVMALKGFQRVMLQPKETKELSFEIQPSALQMLNKQMQWTVEPGEFAIMIGASSADIRLRTSLFVK